MSVEYLDHITMFANSSAIKILHDLWVSLQEKDNKETSYKSWLFIVFFQIYLPQTSEFDMPWHINVFCECLWCSTLETIFVLIFGMLLAQPFSPSYCWCKKSSTSGEVYSWPGSLSHYLQGIFCYIPGGLQDFFHHLYLKTSQRFSRFEKNLKAIDASNVGTLSAMRRSKAFRTWRDCRIHGTWIHGT